MLITPSIEEISRLIHSCTVQIQDIVTDYKKADILESDLPGIRMPVVEQSLDDLEFLIDPE